MAESRFPMYYDKCPRCKCPETIVQLAWDEEAEKGRVNKDTPVAARVEQIGLVDPTKTLGISAGVLIISSDYCAGCGYLYPVRAEVGSGQVKMGPLPGQGKRPPGLPPFMPSS